MMTTDKLILVFWQKRTSKYGKGNILPKFKGANAKMTRKTNTRLKNKHGHASMARSKTHNMTAYQIQYEEHIKFNMKKLFQSMYTFIVLWTKFPNVMYDMKVIDQFREWKVYVSAIYSCTKKMRHLYFCFWCIILFLVVWSLGHVNLHSVHKSFLYTDRYPHITKIYLRINKGEGSGLMTHVSKRDEVEGNMHGGIPCKELVSIPLSVKLISLTVKLSSYHIPKALYRQYSYNS